MLVPAEAGVVLASRRGAIVEERAVGDVDVADGFDIGSLVKPFTAAATNTSSW